MLCQGTPSAYGCGGTQSRRGYMQVARRSGRCRTQFILSFSQQQKGKERAEEGRQSAEPDLQDPSQTVVWGGTLPPKRRAVTGGLSALAIVLVGDLGGATRALLGLDGGRVAGKLHLDVLYPVNGLKRCLDTQNGFEFRYPASWLADQRMFRRNAERQEKMLTLDPPSAGSTRRSVAEPVAAFGPPGSSGELNVSVIVAPIRQGFQLTSLGPPQEAASRFLSTTIAPEGSGLETQLINASERRDESGQVYYNLEYTVKRPEQFFRHNVSSYAARNGSLYTLNAQSPESEWESRKSMLRQTAESFRVTKSGPVQPGLAPPRRQ